VWGGEGTKEAADRGVKAHYRLLTPALIHYSICLKYKHYGCVIARPVLGGVLGHKFKGRYQDKHRYILFLAKILTNIITQILTNITILPRASITLNCCSCCCSSCTPPLKMWSCTAKATSVTDILP
jgi:hypothetical protein